LIALSRRKIERGYILAAVIDIKHTVRCCNHMLWANKCPCALQTPAMTCAYENPESTAHLSLQQQMRRPIARRKSSDNLHNGLQTPFCSLAYIAAGSPLHAVTAQQSGCTCCLCLAALSALLLLRRGTPRYFGPACSIIHILDSGSHLATSCKATCGNTPSAQLPKNAGRRNVEVLSQTVIVLLKQRSTQSLQMKYSAHVPGCLRCYSRRS